MVMTANVGYTVSSVGKEEDIIEFRCMALNPRTDLFQAIQLMETIFQMTEYDYVT